MPRSALGSATCLPFNSTLPPVGAKNPAIIFKRVVFPQPEGPRTESNSPCLIWSVTSLRAWTDPPSGKSNRIDKVSIVKPDIFFPSL